MLRDVLILTFNKMHKSITILDKRLGDKAVTSEDYDISVSPWPSSVSMLDVSVAHLSCFPSIVGHQHLYWGMGGCFEH